MRLGRGSGAASQPAASPSGKPVVAWVEVSRGGALAAIPVLDGDHVKTFPSEQAAFASLSPIGALVGGAKVINRSVLAVDQDMVPIIEVGLKNGRIPD